jgi:hypothetical protein
MSQNKFISEIVQTTQHGINSSGKHNEPEIKKNLISKRDVLYNKITFEWKEKIRKSALKGRTHCYIYFMKKEEDYELLTNRGIYEYLNVNPLFGKLRKFFGDENFNFHVFRDDKFGWVASVSWKHHLQNNDMNKNSKMNHFNNYNNQPKVEIRHIKTRYEPKLACE